MKRLQLALFLLVTGCASQKPLPLVPGDASAPSQITPAESMAIHPWRPFATNILHGEDKAGILVNSPDISHDPRQPRRGWWIPGEVNTGIPYKWGGFDDAASFDAAIAKGLAGGDVSLPAKRRERAGRGRRLLRLRLALPEAADGA
jgi:hypothetical protein